MKRLPTAIPQRTGNKAWKLSFWYIALMLFATIAICSCARDGYGCKGNSKYITGHKP